MKWFYIPKKEPKKRFLLDDILDIASPCGDFLTCQHQNQNWGLVTISPEGKVHWHTEPIFEDANSFSEGFWPFKKEGKWGFANQKGEIELAPSWDHVSPFFQGFAVACLKEKRGFIDKRGKWVIPPKADDLRSYSDDVAVGRIGKTWFVLDVAGKTISLPQGVFLRSFCDGLAAMNWGGALIQGQLVMGGNWGFVDKRGDAVIPPQFSWVGNFSHKWAPYYVEERDEWGLVSTRGQCSPVEGVSGILSVREGEIIVEKEGFWGVQNERGYEIVAPSYGEMKFLGDQGYLGLREEGTLP